LVKNIQIHEEDVVVWVVKKKLQLKHFQGFINIVVLNKRV